MNTTSIHLYHKENKTEHEGNLSCSLKTMCPLYPTVDPLGKKKRYFLFHPCLFACFNARASQKQVLYIYIYIYTYLKRRKHAYTLPRGRDSRHLQALVIPNSSLCLPHLMKLRHLTSPFSLTPDGGTLQL